MERKTILKNHNKGFTLLEAGLSVILLSILALIAFPTVQYTTRRFKEMELRHSLREMRNAIDEYHRYALQGLIEQTDVSQDFYPPDLETLVEGVVLAG
ncbi:MAG: type II secretion system GspH family protein, partial [Acidobacteria bacterium]|nr:type II secretion system GspH family protein [Acidobacteriota bacterium]